MRLYTRSSQLATVGVTALLALSACGSGSSGTTTSGSAGVTANKIMIGTSIPLSGTNAPVCRPIADAAKAWFDHVNKDGGINGRTIQQVVLDDQFVAPQALANARQLVQEPVFAIFGGCGSIQPPAIQTVAGPAKVPFVFPNADLPTLSTAENVFLTIAPYALQQGAISKYSLSKYGAGSVFIVAQQLPHVDTTIDAIKSAVHDQGGEVVGTEVTPAGTADLSPIILKIKAAKPDYVAMNVGADAARLLTGMTQQGALPKKKIFGFSALLTEGVVAASKGLPDGMIIVAAPVAPVDSSGFAECKAVLDAVSPTLTNDNNANMSCASAQALTAALKDSGKDLTRKSFEKTLLSWTGKEASTALPPLTFDSSSHVGPKSTFAVTLDGGKIHLLSEIPLP